MKVQQAFEVINLAEPCVFIRRDNSRFDLRTGIPNNSLEVYKSGFKYLGLKPGAEVLFKRDSAAELIRLINQARRIEDVDILALAKPDATTVQAAAEERKKELLTTK